MAHVSCSEMGFSRFLGHHADSCFYCWIEFRLAVSRYCSCSGDFIVANRLGRSVNLESGGRSRGLWRLLEVHERTNATSRSAQRHSQYQRREDPNSGQGNGKLQVGRSVGGFAIVWLIAVVSVSGTSNRGRTDSTRRRGKARNLHLNRQTTAGVRERRVLVASSLFSE